MKFGPWFSEPVVYDDKEFRLLFEGGKMKGHRVKNMEVSDTRPFLWGRLPDEALGKTIKVRNKIYSIESVEDTGEDSFVYYLGEKRNTYKL